MGIFLQFKRFLHDQYYFPVIVIHVQLCKHSFAQETASKKKTGRINRMNT